MKNLPYPFLMDSLSTIFLNEVPEQLPERAPLENMEPWQLAEEVVYWFFRYAMSLPTKKLGGNALFKHEPEGLVTGLGPDRNRALIYECKCRSGHYTMSHDDFLRYQSYIRSKRNAVRAFYLELTNFVVIAPSFRGQYRRKLETLSEGGVNVSAMTADCFKQLYEGVKDWRLERIVLLDLCRIFHTGLVEVGAVSEEITRAGEEYDSFS